MNAEILAAILGVEGLEPWPDEYVFVRASGIRAPCDPTRPGVECGEPSANTHFAAAVADDHLALDDQWRHGHRLAFVHVSERRDPAFLSGRRVERHCSIVE